MLSRRGAAERFDELLVLDGGARERRAIVEADRASRGQFSKQAGEARKRGESDPAAEAEAKRHGDAISVGEDELRGLDVSLPNAVR